MPPGLVLGVDEPVVDGHLEGSVGRRDEGDLLDARLKRLEQFGCQTGSLLGVVSNRAVFDSDTQEWLLVKRWDDYTLFSKDKITHAGLVQSIRITS